MTEDPRSLADQAYQAIVSTGQEINRAQGQSVIRDAMDAAVLVARSNLAIALAILAHAEEGRTDQHELQQQGQAN